MKFLKWQGGSTRLFAVLTWIILKLIGQQQWTEFYNWTELFYTPIIFQSGDKKGIAIPDLISFKINSTLSGERQITRETRETLDNNWKSRIINFSA